MLIDSEAGESVLSEVADSAAGNIIEVSEEDKLTPHPAKKGNQDPIQKVRTNDDEPFQTPLVLKKTKQRRHGRRSCDAQVEGKYQT
jgi:hypothetical protein